MEKGSQAQDHGQAIYAKIRYSVSSTFANAYSKATRSWSLNLAHNMPLKNEHKIMNILISHIGLAKEDHLSFIHTQPTAMIFFAFI